jgi:hypothetical protein
MTRTVVAVEHVDRAALLLRLGVQVKQQLQDAFWGGLNARARKY